MPIFNDQGALEDGQEFRDARQGALIRAEDYVASQPYFAAQNDREKVRFDRTLIPVMQDGVHQVNDANQPLYMTPERQVFLQNEQYLDAIENKENSDFERRVSNPFFKVSDFAADLFRNTVGLPVNLLTGSNGFHVDPSESAVEGYKARLMELDKLRVANHKMFIDGRDKRASAFASAATKTIGSPVNTAQGLAVAVQNEDGTIGSEYVPDPSGSGEPLRTQRFEIVDMGNGVKAVVDRQDPTAPVRYLNDVDTIASDASQISQSSAEGTQIGTARGKAIMNYPVLEQSIADSKSTIAKLLAHPGLPKVVGTPMQGYPNAMMAGTDEADFYALFEELSGEKFMAGRIELKGGGSITDFEGIKAEQALKAMSFKMKADTFRQQLMEYDKMLDGTLIIAKNVIDGKYTTQSGNTYQEVD